MALSDIEKKAIQELQKESPVDVKKAALIAEHYLKSLIVHVSNIMLEEVELTDDERFWLITLSYNDTSSDLERIFKKWVKIFKIRRDDGKVMSMKIREIE